jgi:hypothetical protein
MSKHTSTVAARVEKARRFDAALPNASDDDWRVITAFYCALHWAGAAYEYQHQQPPPVSHTDARKEYGHALPDRIFRAYRALQSYSEVARYELDVPMNAEDAEIALQKLDDVRQWAKSILKVL